MNAKSLVPTIVACFLALLVYNYVELRLPKMKAA